MAHGSMDPAVLADNTDTYESIVPHGAWQYGPCDFAQGDGNDFAEGDGSGRLMSFKEATA